MHRIVSDAALDILFRNTCSHRAWLDRPVTDTLLRAVWELVKLGPAAEASCPARILFARSAKAKERLAPALAAKERAGMTAAPVAAILAADIGAAGNGRLAGADALPTARARRDGALRAGYLILAARSLGLDCRPIWDFDARAVEAAFFPGGTAVASFLCGLGYGDGAQVEPNSARSGVDEAYQIL